jgi:hypothetical protein
MLDEPPQYENRMLGGVRGAPVGKLLTGHLLDYHTCWLFKVFLYLRIICNNFK